MTQQVVTSSAKCDYIVHFHHYGTLVNHKTERRIPRISATQSTLVKLPESSSSNASTPFLSSISTSPSPEFQPVARTSS